MSYRLRLEWVGGTVTHTVFYSRKRDAEKMYRSFWKVALMSKVVMQRQERPGHGYVDVA